MTDIFMDILLVFKVERNLLSILTRHCIIITGVDLDSLSRIIDTAVAIMRKDEDTIIYLLRIYPYM